MNKFVAALLGALMPWCAGAADSVSVGFDEALAVAESNAPSLAAAGARDAAARQAAIAAGELPDPKLIVGLDNLPVTGADDWSLGRDFMTMQRVGVSQEWPNAGKRKARVAEAQAAIADAEFVKRAERLTVRKDAALAWLGAYYSVARLALQDELTHENALLEKTTAARYAGGSAASAELLAARREALLLADQRDELLAAEAAANAELRRVLGRPAVIKAGAAVPAIDIDAAHLRAHLEQHPDLRVYDARVAAASAALREAEASKRPDWNVELAYQHRGAALRRNGVGASLDRPALVQRAAPGPDHRGARRRRRRHERRSEPPRYAVHEAELERDLADYQRLAQQRQRMRDARLPLAEQALSLAYRAYAAGEASLAELLAARRELANLRFDALNLDAALTHGRGGKSISVTRVANMTEQGTQGFAKSALMMLVILALGIAVGVCHRPWRQDRRPRRQPSAASPSASPAAAPTPAERKVLYWYDPMKPDQHFDKPGRSPFMDMDLVPRYAEPAMTASDAPHRQRRRHARCDLPRRLGLRTVQATRGHLESAHRRGR
jgi:cobalt-zinc-cadmium efflux system outer membrane protein